MNCQNRFECPSPALVQTHAQVDVNYFSVKHKEKKKEANKLNMVI